MLLLAGSALLVTHSVTEGDLFWHIKTGQYIWQHRDIPSEDPFAFTTRDSRSDSHAEWQQFVLKQYWLSQLLYFALYATFGIPSVVVLRALVLVMILLSLFLWMRARDVRFATSTVFIFLVAFYLKNLGDRPQNFSFLLFAVLAYLLDSYSARGAHSPFRLPLLMLVPLMLVWSNMHGGYVMGVALIVIYALGAALRAMKDPGGRPYYVKALSIYILATSASFLNPNFYRVYPVLLRELQEGVLDQYVGEFMSPVQAALRFGDLQPSYWIIIAITMAVLLLRGRRMSVERILAVICFAAASLKAQRMIWFYLMLVPILADEVEHILHYRFQRSMKALAALCMLLLLLSLYTFRHGLLEFNVDSSFPIGASQFLNKTHPSGNLFNHSDWGGFLMLNAPGYKVFSDGRRLNPDIEYVHAAVMLGVKIPVDGTPAWKKYLADYGIDIILIPYRMPVTGTLAPLVVELYRSPEWKLVFSDETALIYLREDGDNDSIISSFSVPKDLSLLTFIETLPQDRIENVRLIADLYTLMGRPEAAQSFYRLLGR